MSLYDLPQLKNKTSFLFGVILLSSFFGLAAGSAIGAYAYWKIAKELNMLRADLGERVVEKERLNEKEYIPQTTQEQRIIEVVKSVSPSVVSIVITKDVPVVEQFFFNPFEDFFGPSPFQIPQLREKGTEKREVGGGSGFFISTDGLIVTNKHVVLDKEAEYTVFTNDGKSYQAQVLARDPFEDLAVLKIVQEQPIRFPAVTLGDSENLQIGQTVIAIGNALGEFRNTVSVGVISGLQRTIEASGGEGFVETLENLVQTDAAINRGNSGGPLLNLAGEVIGINTAIAQQAQNIGFTIPVNKAKRDVEQVKELGKIAYPFLGVRYVAINEKVREEEGLPVDYGILVLGGRGEPAITPGSAAEKAGLQERDIIVELNGEKITLENSFAKMIREHNPGDAVILKILRNGQQKLITATLRERSE